MIRSPICTRQRLLQVLLPLVAALAMAGCRDEIALPTEAQLSRGSFAVGRSSSNTPEATVRRLLSSFSRLDADWYVKDMTENYLFVFAAQDSAGNPYRGIVTREDEFTIGLRMFETGTAEHPPLRRASVRLHRPLASLPDPRSGKDPEVHRLVRATFELEADNGQEAFRVFGASLFFLVRGDSAIIPPGAVAAGARPASSRWWIERWEDEGVAGPAPLARDPLPARDLTIGALKRLYLE
jgi:hypothetical protein